MTGMSSPKSLLVEGILHHMRDLHPRFMAPEKDSNSTSESDNASESRAECLLIESRSDLLYFLFIILMTNWTCQ